MAVPLALTFPVLFEDVLRMNALPHVGFGPDVPDHPQFPTGQKVRLVLQTLGILYP